MSNQLTIAKTESFSHLQIFEKIPELRFKYMGSYPSDKVPELTIYSFTVINSAPSNDRRENSILIARLDKSYYFEDSLARDRSIYPFLTKKYRRMLLLKLQKTDNLCEFYSSYSTFILFKLFQKNLNNVHDVHVLNFFSNFM